MQVEIKMQEYQPTLRMKRDIFEVQWDTACTALESKFSDNMIAGDSFLIVRALKAQLFEQNIILSDFT